MILCCCCCCSCWFLFVYVICIIDGCLYLFIEIQSNRQYFHATWYLMMWLSWRFDFHFVGHRTHVSQRKVPNYTDLFGGCNANTERYTEKIQFCRCSKWNEGQQTHGWKKTSKIIWFLFETNWIVALRSNFNECVSFELIHGRKCDRNKWWNPN